MHFSGKSQKQPLTSGTMRKHLVKFHDIRNNRNSSRLNSILHGTSRFQAEQNDRRTGWPSTSDIDTLATLPRLA